MQRNWTRSPEAKGGVLQLTTQHKTAKSSEDNHSQSSIQTSSEVQKKLIDDGDKEELPVKIIEEIELAHYKIKLYVPAIGKEVTLEWYH